MIGSVFRLSSVINYNVKKKVSISLWTGDAYFLFIFMEFCNRKDYLVNRSTRSWPSS